MVLLVKGQRPQIYTLANSINNNLGGFYIMKKNLFLIAALVLGATAAVSTNVSAADTPANGEGKATLNITAGTFSQVGAPSFSFETKIDNALVTAGKSVTSIGSADTYQTLKVSDYVGTDNGWTVTAKLDAFDNPDVKVGSLVITPGDVKTDSDAISAGKDFTLVPGDAAADVASAQTGAGDTTLAYADNSAKLNLSKNTKVASSTAILTWKATQGKITAPKFN